MIERTVEYRLGDTSFEGLLVSAGSGARPAVLIFPTIMGRSELELGFARRLAGDGHASVIADLYGREHLGRPREECRGLMDALLAARALLRERLLAALAAARAQPEVDPGKVAAIGFCFGGLCALDLARAGADVRGVASFHGLLKPPVGLPPAKIVARVVVFHGWEDPLAPAQDVAALGNELIRAGADWEVHAYEGVRHGFMNPQANDPAAGILYDEQAAKRAWSTFETYLREWFAA